jgi:hypothetical protein
MIFLIEYDRSLGRIVTISSFRDLDRRRAEESRLKLELDLNEKSVDHEIVLLEAENEEAVRKTHRRYFEDLFELTSVPTS